MSLWMARVPVTLSDVVRAVSEGKVPYMDWGRRTVDDMRERMSKGLKGMSPKVSCGVTSDWSEGCGGMAEPCACIFILCSPSLFCRLPRERSKTLLSAGRAFKLPEGHKGSDPQ